MLIEKKRIRNSRRYLTLYEEGAEIRIGVLIDGSIMHKMVMEDFTEDLNEGEYILPDAGYSKASFDNSEGKVIVRRDIPKEIAERYWEWSWEDFAGNSYSDGKFISYERYTREYLPPEALNLYIASDKDDNKWIVSKILKVSEYDFDKIKLAINLFLSLFGKCEVIDKDLNLPVIPKKYLNWEILRPGQNNDKDIDTAVDRIIERRISDGKKSLYLRNIAFLRKNNPEVIAIGNKGFSGYIVFNYADKGIAVLESLMPNNATYVLNEDWIHISKYTKSEVLAQSLHKDRIYHYGDWEQRIKQYIV